MAGPAKTEDQNILPVQALFNLDNSFNTFIGQGQPFVVSATESIGIQDVTSLDATLYPTLSPVSTGQVTTLDVTSTKLTFNPLTGTLAASEFDGFLNGTAAHANNLANGTSGQIPYQTGSSTTGFVTNGSAGQVLTSNGSGAPTWSNPSAAITLQDDTSTNATRYPLFADNTSGFVSVEYTSSTKYQFNPSTGVLTASGFAGAGTGLTGTASSLSIGGNAATSTSSTTATNLAGGANGSVPYQTGSGTTTMLSAGSNGQVLTLSGGVPTWAAAATSGITITDDTTTNADRYLTFTSATAGSITGENVSSTKLKYNPSTGTLTSSALNTSGGLLSNVTLSGAIVDNANPYLDFGNGSAVTLAAGRMWYNGSDGSWNLGMGNGNITQQVGEELFRYGKASAAITDSPLQLVYKTGVVGASGVITFAPAVAGITDSNNILGCATEPIALNGFGRVTTYGVIHGITTNGTAYGETWADNDDIYYNPVTGGLTKTYPTAPGLKMLIGTVINAAGGGAGSFIVKLGYATYLSKLSDVQITSVANNNILQYDSAAQYWKNVSSLNGVPVGNSTASTGAFTTLVGSTSTTTPIVQNSAASSIVFNTNSGSSAVQQFSVAHTASAVNYVQVTGAATSGDPTISTQGSDANRNLALAGKGAGSVITNSVFKANANLANYVQIDGGATTIAPKLSSQGSDTNISQVFQSKGTGAIDLAAGSSGVNISNGGTVTAITRTANGSGYTSLPSIAISAPTTAGGVQATATASVFANTATVVSGGTGYTLNDVVTLVGGTPSGSGATYTVTGVSGGVVTAVSPLNFQSYTALPANPVSVTGGTGSGLTLTVTYGYQSASITNAGSGYVEQPTVTFSGGGGSGAAAYATVGATVTIKGLYGGSSQVPIQFAGPAGNILQIMEAGNTSSPVPLVIKAGGSSTQLYPNGSNIPLQFSSSGTGGLNFYTNTLANEQFRVSHTASAVNYVQVTGAATGARPVISAQGSDANIDISVQTKGNGQFIVKNGAGGNAFTTTTTNANPTNQINVTSTGTGTAPAVQAVGTDTNIDLALTPKGTGQTNAGGAALNAKNGLVVNSQTVAISYTIAAGDSAMSAGPITVASGITVTLSSGSRWVVL